VHGHQGDLRLPLHHRRRRLHGAEAEGRRHLAGARMVRPGHPVLHGLRRRRLSAVKSGHRRTDHHFIHRPSDGAEVNIRWLGSYLCVVMCNEKYINQCMKIIQLCKTSTKF